MPRSILTLGSGLGADPKWVPSFPKWVFHNLPTFLIVCLGEKHDLNNVGWLSRLGWLYGKPAVYGKLAVYEVFAELQGIHSYHFRI